MKRFATFAVLIPNAVFASSFDRPIPQAQSATAELLFGIASFGLVAALVFVGKLVSRR